MQRGTFHAVRMVEELKLVEELKVVGKLKAFGAHALP